jgi:4-hydroxybenzoate polyprenyltransferase
MYFLGLIVILLIALAIFFSPIFAVVIFLLLLVGLGAYKFLARGTEPEHAPVGESPAAGAVMGKHEAAERGMWGEKRPEEQAGGEEPS